MTWTVIAYGVSGVQLPPQTSWAASAGVEGRARARYVVVGTVAVEIPRVREGVAGIGVVRRRRIERKRVADECGVGSALWRDRCLVVGDRERTDRVRGGVEPTAATSTVTACVPGGTSSTAVAVGDTVGARCCLLTACRW